MTDLQSKSGLLRKCVLILNWNSYKDTIIAIDSLRGFPWPVAVIDNASRGTLDVNEIRGRFPDITLIENEENLGYAGGMNVGMRWANSEGFTHALLLNPDTLPTVEVMQAMDALSPNAAIVGTAQVTSDLKPYVSAAMMDGRKPRSFTCDDNCGLGHDVDIVSGAALLVELETAESVNYIDERFFHYKEEFDFCYRVRLAGGNILYSCDPKLVHKQGGSLSTTSPGAAYYWYRNEILFLKKHFGSFGWLSGLGIIRNAMLTLRRAPLTWTSAMRGVFHGIRGITGPSHRTSSTLRPFDSVLFRSRRPEGERPERQL